MKIIKKNKELRIEDIETSETLKELREIIESNYYKDDTFSEQRIKETLDGIIKGYYDLTIENDEIHMEVEFGLGALDWNWHKITTE